jgi:hypothetical protein
LPAPSFAPPADCLLPVLLPVLMLMLVLVLVLILSNDPVQ